MNLKPLNSEQVNVVEESFLYATNNHKTLKQQQIAISAWQAGYNAAKIDQWLPITGMQEKARLHAERLMPIDWDRKDHILIGAFYRHFIYYIFRELQDLRDGQKY